MALLAKVAPILQPVPRPGRSRLTAKQKIREYEHKHDRALVYDKTDGMGMMPS